MGSYLLRDPKRSRQDRLGDKGPRSLRAARDGRLSDELDAVGFSAIRVAPFRERRIYDREPALRAIRGSFASSFALMSEGEYHASLERAERELPEKVESVLELEIVTARR